MKKNLFLLFTLITFHSNAQLTDLHDFSSGNSGDYGYGSLTISGTVLYGTKGNGGANGYGFIFSMNTDGTGFTDLYDFPLDNTNPCGSLLLDNGVLYGMTAQNDGAQGGTNVFSGTIYSINIDGSGYTTLHIFTGIGTDGSEPHGSLIISGNILYGMTKLGGVIDGNGINYGMIFSIFTDGTNFTNLHSFSSTESCPYGSLTRDGNVLYGMTSGLCSNSKGNIFSINLDGSGYTSLHNFTGSDGKYPNGSLTLSGNVLYGMTVAGGAGAMSDRGNVFAINKDGTGLHTIKDNLYSTNNVPFGSLVLVGNTLYGLLEKGIYYVNTDGTGSSAYGLVNTYNYGTYNFDGYDCNSHLTLASNGILYGRTHHGAAQNCGVIFSCTPAGTSVNELSDLTHKEINVFPNPSNGNISLNFNDYSPLKGYTVKITNTLGQVVFTSLINQQQSNIEITTLIDEGIYFVNILDYQSQIIDVKKVVLQ